MQVQLGDRVQCVMNKDSTFWWEFLVGKSYIVTEKEGKLRLKTENRNCGTPNFIEKPNSFFRDFQENDNIFSFANGSTKGLRFKLIKRCGSREEIE